MKKVNLRYSDGKDMARYFLFKAGIGEKLFTRPEAAALAFYQAEPEEEPRIYMIGSDQRRISQDLKRVGYTKIALKHGKDARSIKSEQGYEKFVPASNHDLCREFI